MDFRDFRRYDFGTLGNEANINFLYSIIETLVVFPLTPKHMTLNGHFTFKFNYNEQRFSD